MYVYVPTIAPPTADAYLQILRDHISYPRTTCAPNLMVHSDKMTVVVMNHSSDTHQSIFERKDCCGGTCVDWPLYPRSRLKKRDACGWALQSHFNALIDPQLERLRRKKITLLLPQPDTKADTVDGLKRAIGYDETTMPLLRAGVEGQTLTVEYMRYADTIPSQCTAPKHSVLSGLKCARPSVSR